MRWILLKGGHVFDPKDRGTADVLTLGREIAVVGPDLTEPRGVGDGEVVEVSHRILLPGLIDPHIHVMGASGLGGPTTRSTDLQIERITTAGVTTVVSPLGADSLTRSIPCLLARAAALEYEEVLKQKLPPERWGWAAIHLCNLYFKLNQLDKSVAFLRRVEAELKETAAAEKARKRLEELGLSISAEELAPEQPEAPSSGPKLPPGFTLKKT